MANILVAEDEEVVRELIRSALERDGHRIQEATTGLDTLNKLKNQAVDLLVLDVMLPGMDGHTLQLQMAQDEKTSRVPVVVLTALQTAKSLFTKFPQVKAFLSKPFDPVDLSQTVARVLSDVKAKA